MHSELYTFGAPDGPPLDLQEPGISAGNGEFFFVTNPPEARPGVVKVLARPHRKAAHFERIERLVSQLPWSTSQAWPLRLIYEDAQPAGYWTATVKGSRPLRQWLEENAGVVAFGQRLRVCQHLVKAVQVAHAPPYRCVLTNLTPDGILVQPNGNVQLLNLETAQVLGADGTVLFPAQLEFSPFTPPEATTGPNRPGLLSAEWDWYSLAAVFNELLTGPSVWPRLREDLALGLDKTPAYRLTATQWLKTLSAAPPPPQLLSFNVSPAEIPPGESITVQWRTKDAAPVRLYGPDAPTDDLDPEGELQLFPKKSGTYTLNAQGLEARQAVVIKRPLPPPPPPPLPPLPEVSLEITPPELRTGHSVTLRWKTAHAERLTLTGPDVPSGPVPSSGELTLKPRKAGTLAYVLQAANAAGSEDRRAEAVVRAPSRAWVGWLLATLVALSGFIWYLLASGGKTDPTPAKQTRSTQPKPPKVRPGKPRIVSFTVTPTRIREGETVTLAWRVDDAGQTPIRLSGPGVRPIDRAPVESTTGQPFAGVRTYELRVGDAFARVTVYVEKKETATPQIVRFDASPAAPEPGQPAVLHWRIENAASAELYGPTGLLDVVPPTGQRTVYPTQDALYRLQAGTATRRFLVRVAQPVAGKPLHPHYCDETGLWGYAQGNRVVIPCQFERVRPFNGDRANVRYQGQNVQINRKGEFVD